MTEPTRLLAPAQYRLPSLAVSGASITLDGNKIILKASGGILIEATGGDVTVKGTPKIKLNP